MYNNKLADRIVVGDVLLLTAVGLGMYMHSLTTAAMALLIYGIWLYRK